MEIVLVKEKETTGNRRFKENKEDHPMTIYLTKNKSKNWVFWNPSKLQ